MSYLGLDIGSSGCKAVIFSREGKELSSAYKEYSLISSQPGWAELDSNNVIKQCFSVIKEAALKCSDDQVMAMGISSQGEAFTPINPDGDFSGNGMISSDCRAVEIAEKWSREFGINKLYQITGHTAHPLFTLFKLIWIRENQPDIWKQSRSFYCFEDLMHYKLGIEPAISWPLAGRTMLFDVQKHIWSHEILDAAGLKSEQLARPLPSGSVAGIIPENTAKQLGLPDKVKVVTGGHDQPCAALGAGVIEPGTSMYATGTVECFCPLLENPQFSDDLLKNNLCCYDFTIKDRYTTVAYSLTGGNILKWFRDNFGREEIKEAEKTNKNPYELLLKKMPEEPTGLLVLPYFTPSGTPYFETNIKGGILGLEITTKREEIMKALLEGVAMEMRLNLKIMEHSGMHIKKFIATGGGTRSKQWVQLKADILNRPVTTIDINEAGCFGAAMLACAAHTGTPVQDLVKPEGRKSDIIIPDPKKAEIYNKKFKQYIKLYPAIKELYN